MGAKCSSFRMSPKLKRMDIDPSQFPPLGIERGPTNYCYIISLFQMLCYTVPYENLSSNKPLQNLVKKYHGEQKNGLKISTIKASEIAKAMGVVGNEMDSPGCVFKEKLEDKISKKGCGVIFEERPNSIDSPTEQNHEQSSVIPIVYIPDQRKTLSRVFYDHFKRTVDLEANKIERRQFSFIPENLLLEFNMKLSPISLRKTKKRIKRLIRIKSLFTPVKKLPSEIFLSERLTIVVNRIIRLINRMRNKNKKIALLKYPLKLEDTISLHPGKEVSKHFHQTDYLLSSLIVHLPAYEHYKTLVRLRDGSWYDCNDTEIVHISKPGKTPKVNYLSLACFRKKAQQKRFG